VLLTAPEFTPFCVRDALKFCILLRESALFLAQEIVLPDAVALHMALYSAIHLLAVLGREWVSVEAPRLRPLKLACIVQVLTLDILRCKVVLDF
jgi:hypothetical protein